MKILGIETSCDETAASIIEGKDNQIKVLSNIISSQINIHQKYGGVVPELAAREHVLNILPVIDQAIKNAHIKKSEISKKIKAIAITPGPGLITSLMTGVETAKTLSYSWNIPIVTPNHIESHIYANFIDNKQKIKFPALVLTVSGGHTMLILMKNHGQFNIIGETRDDAAGEAFDKTAKLLGLGYPGGPIISERAEEFKNDIKKIKFPRPMINSNNFDFSFSGLKTAVRYAIQKDNNYKERIPQYCHELEEAIVDVLLSKTIKAALVHKVKTIMLSGGVSANKKLRDKFINKIKDSFKDIQLLIPNLKFTTDNAAMVATAGYFHAKENNFLSWHKLKSYPNLEI